jgi:NADPH:quinone reductase-like Zn-dependent oxidoreductase
VKAAVSTRYGPPEVVQVTEVAKPTVADDELLVKVHATTVNRTDCGYRAGTPFIVRFFSGLRGPKATILGNEFGGEVEAVGNSVTSFRVGDRVFGYNEGPFGAHAEYLAIAERASVATKPRGVTAPRSSDPWPRTRCWRSSPRRRAARRSCSRCRSTTRRWSGT